MHRYTVLYVLEDCSRRSYDGLDVHRRQILAPSPQAAKTVIEEEYDDLVDWLCVIVGVIAGWNKVLV